MPASVERRSTEEVHVLGNTWEALQGSTAGGRCGESSRHCRARKGPQELSCSAKQAAPTSGVSGDEGWVELGSRFPRLLLRLAVVKRRLGTWR